METIEIPYKPYTYFSDNMHNNNARFKVLVMHRRSGKTLAAVNQLLKDALITKGIYAYIAPTFRMAKRIAWDYLKDMSKVLPKVIFNEAELSALLPNGSKIYLLGAEAYDTLRGIGLSGVIMDEFADIPEKAFTTVILPALTDKSGYAIFIGTPKGKENHLYKYYQKSETNWYSKLLNCYDTNVLKETEIEAMKQNMPEVEFKQEMLCEFTEGSNYSYFDSPEQVMTLPGLSRDTNGQFIMGVDLGKKQDYTVISVMQKGTNRLVDFDRFQLSWVSAKERIAKIARQYNNARVVIDSTGLGDPILDDLKLKENLNIIGYHFSHNSKRNLMNKLSNYISQHNISLTDIPELTKELKNFGYFDMENIESGHDDCVCSLALAVWELDTPQVIQEVSDRIWMQFNKTI